MAGLREQLAEYSQYAAISANGELQFCVVVGCHNMMLLMLLLQLRIRAFVSNVVPVVSVGDGDRIFVCSCRQRLKPLPE